MNSLFPLIPTDRLAGPTEFYRTVFGLEVVAELDWYVQLQHPSNEAIQIAFISSDHDSVPVPYRATPKGVLVTIEVEDAAAVRDVVGSSGHPVVVELRDEAWGQRHFMTQDPTGLLVDVVQQLASHEVEPSPAA
jgi:uncharacterized glyoxalase superfamily protein PhnB